MEAIKAEMNNLITCSMLSSWIWTLNTNVELLFFKTFIIECIMQYDLVIIVMLPKAWIKKTHVWYCCTYSSNLSHSILSGRCHLINEVIMATSLLVTHLYETFISLCCVFQFVVRSLECEPRSVSRLCGVQPSADLVNQPASGWSVTLAVFLIISSHLAD